MIKRNLLFILCLIFIAAGVAIGQTRTVTNDDLAKFREKRLQAEKDLRENYERLGFPSPAELDRRFQQESLEREQLSDKLRRERLAREQAERDQAYWDYERAVPDFYFVQNHGAANSSYGSFLSYSGARGRFHRRNRTGGTYLPGGGYFGPSFNPNQGVQINTTGISINTTGTRRPIVRIRSPR